MADCIHGVNLHIIAQWDVIQREVVLLGSQSSLVDSAQVRILVTFCTSQEFEDFFGCEVCVPLRAQQHGYALWRAGGVP
jgi:hypothetical protein